MTDINAIDTIAVIGTGTIGASWTALFLGAGKTVRAWDPAPGAEDRLREAVTQAWSSLEQLGGHGGQTVAAALTRLSFHPDPAEAAQGADFVQENAPERIEIKRDTYARIESTLRDDVIISSSTSGIMPSELQAGMMHPERLVVGHPFNPPHLVPLVEIVPGKQTSEQVAEAAVAFYRAIGKTPVRLHKEVIGHIANRLQGAVLRETLHLALEGVASVQDIDLAMSMGPGQRWAFMGQAKLFGLAGGQGAMAHFLDHIGPAVEDWWADLGTPHLTPEARAILTEAYPEMDAETFRKAVDWRDQALLRRLRALAEDTQG
ncbi:MAG TPA: 3-hydroxyacyl-CoA dehydrogenase NAD-binding domain-containing protein [Paenirhodobacter sp.]